MDSTGSKLCVATLPKRDSHRLLFDRRYGWVFDEWKDPSEEALAGGRGMFCIVPLAKAFFNTASQSINHAANFAVKAFERPDLFSPDQALQATLDDQLNRFMSSINTAEFNGFSLRGKFSSQNSHFPSQLSFGNRESQID